MGDNKKGYFKKSDEKGSINISEEVITVIAATAAVEVPGVHGLFVSHGREITSVNGRKGLHKGVRLSNDNNKLNVDVYIVAKMGFPVNELGAEVQKAVVSSVEGAAGIKVNEINVHICGVALKKARPMLPAVFSSKKEPSDKEAEVIAASEEEAVKKASQKKAPQKKAAPKKAVNKKVTEKKTPGAKKTPAKAKSAEKAE